MITYLAGGINGLSDSDAKDWREAAKEHLLTDTLDPMRNDYRGREMEEGIAAEIVIGDQRDIRACNVVLASCLKPSWGTAMEIHYASVVQKPVFAVIALGTEPSPWLKHFCREIFYSFEDAIDAINSLSGVRHAK